MISTSYNKEGNDLIQSFVKAINPKVTHEIGTQQGASAITIGKMMSKDTKLYTCDTFEDVYKNYPNMPTKANIHEARINMKKAELSCNYEIIYGDHTCLLKKDRPDLLHIDICNHYNNIFPIMKDMIDIVKKAIILEGGISNTWQQKFGFKSFRSMLREEWISKDWDSLTIPLDTIEHYAVTFMIRK